MKEFFTMAYDNQTNESKAQRKFIQEIETMLYSKDGISIFVRAWVSDNPQRVLVCVQGLCGHGLSEGVRGDIGRFDRYIIDVDVAVNWARNMWPDMPIFVLGESMGASIAIQYVISGLYRTHQIPLAGLVFISPVFSSTIRPTFGEVVHFVRSLMIAAKRPSIAVTGREELGCRDSAFNAFLRADPLFVRLVSARFLILLTIWLWKSKRKACQINQPLLVLLGGRDYIARRSGISSFLRSVSAREQRIVTFPQAYHCLLRDPDTPDVVGVINEWLIAHQGK